MCYWLGGDRISDLSAFYRLGSDITDRDSSPQGSTCRAPSRRSLCWRQAKRPAPPTKCQSRCFTIRCHWVEDCPATKQHIKPVGVHAELLHVGACARGLLLLLYSLVTGPRRSLSLELSDTRVHEPQIRARLRTTAQSPTTPHRVACPAFSASGGRHPGGNPGANLKSISHIQIRSGFVPGKDLVSEEL